MLKLSYCYKSMNVYSFDYFNWSIARTIYMTSDEFNKLMIDKFNAKFLIIGNDAIDDMIFEKEEDAKAAVNYLNEILESISIMDKLIKGGG